MQHEELGLIGTVGEELEQREHNKQLKGISDHG